MIAVGDEITPDVVQQIAIDASNALAQVNQAFATLTRIAETLDNLAVAPAQKVARPQADVTPLLPSMALLNGSKYVDFKAKNLTTAGSAAISGAFGCNSATAQTAYASGGAAPAGGVGTAAGGWDTAAHRDAAITLLNNIRSALVANGIMT